MVLIPVPQIVELSMLILPNHDPQCFESVMIISAKEWEVSEFKLNRVIMREIDFLQTPKRGTRTKFSTLAYQLDCGTQQSN